MKTLIQRFFQTCSRQRGAGKVEYIILVAILGIGAIGGIRAYTLSIKHYSCDKIFDKFETAFGAEGGEDLYLWDAGGNSEGLHCYMMVEVEPGWTDPVYLF